MLNNETMERQPSSERTSQPPAKGRTRPIEFNSRAAECWTQCGLTSPGFAGGGAADPDDDDPDDDEPDESPTCGPSSQPITMQPATDLVYPRTTAGR